MYHPLKLGTTKILSFFNLSCSEDHNFPGNNFMTTRRVSLDSERIGLSTHTTFYNKSGTVWIWEKSAFLIFSHFIDNPLIKARHLSRIASIAYSKSHRAKREKTRPYPSDLFGSISIKSQMTLKNVDLHFGRSYLILRYFRLFRLLNRAGLIIGIAVQQVPSTARTCCQPDGYIPKGHLGLTKHRDCRE